MLHRTKKKILLATALLSVFGLGVLIQESVASAYTCPNGGSTCWCGDLDLDPTSLDPVLPGNQWFGDCQDLQADCAAVDASPEWECDYSGGAFGGFCECIRVG